MCCLQVWNKCDLLPDQVPDAGAEPTVPARGVDTLPESEDVEGQAAPPHSSTADEEGSQSFASLSPAHTAAESAEGCAGGMPWEWGPAVPRAAAVATSTVTGAGLAELLREVDRKVAVKFGAQVDTGCVSPGQGAVLHSSLA